MVLSIAILIVMGSVLEGAAALIIFGPLSGAGGRAARHRRRCTTAWCWSSAMGIGLFAPPLGLGLYGSCLIGGVKLEETVWPIMKYLGLLLACLVLIALVPDITTWLPRHTGY